ncbi:MAG TPA: hypothetical protein VGI87_03580, partial [Solirubrobacteraceae bacterium]
TPGPGSGGNLYIDPSGLVRTTTGAPVAGATVTLLAATTSAGPFGAVPNGSAVMSPSNRANPDHTDAFGAFGWDTLPGYYKVTASHKGCTAPTGGTTAATQVYAVPPPVTNILIKLRCPHLKRAKTTLRLRISNARGGTRVVTATVRGKHAQGVVTFRAGALTAPLPLAGRHHSASFVLPSGVKRVRARYGGDAKNRPASATATAR